MLIYNYTERHDLLQILIIDSDAIIQRLTSENINCCDQFQDLLTNSKSLNKTIYLVTKIQPVDGILSLVKKTNKIKNNSYQKQLSDNANQTTIDQLFIHTYNIHEHT